MAATTEELGRKLQTTRDLGSVVSTMKALAAVNIRHFERAAESLRAYVDNVTLGLRAALRARPSFQAGARSAEPGGPLAALILGSDQGMCGSLNEQVARFSLDFLNEVETDNRRHIVLAVGERIRTRLEESNQNIETKLSLPGSVAGITPAVQKVLFILDEWQRQGKADRFYIFHAQQTSGATFEPVGRQLLPIDRVLLSQLSTEPWPTNQLPMLAGDWSETFSALVHQFLLASLFRAFADSLASENASRLAAMQGAERNIEDRLEQLSNDYNQMRQQSITEELLDIAAGFEVLQGSDY